MQKIVTASGQAFYATDKQVAALDTLSKIRHGGFAQARGYSPNSGWLERPTCNLIIITAFSVTKMYERHLAALQSLKWSDVEPFYLQLPAVDGLKFARMDPREIFAERLAQEIASKQKTLAGDRSDAHRQAHDRNYATVDQGVKVNFVTEKVDGIEQPVLHKGLPVAATILVNAIEMQREYTKQGVRKVVNSGCSVLMKNCIESALYNKGVRGMITLRLAEDNFEELRVSNEVIQSNDVETVSL